MTTGISLTLPPPVQEIGTTSLPLGAVPSGLAIFIHLYKPRLSIFALHSKRVFGQNVAVSFGFKV